LFSTSTPKATEEEDAIQPPTKLAAKLWEERASAGVPSQFGGLVYQKTTDPRFRVLFVLGGPGAGKGTQSALMEEHYPTAHFSVGALLRQEQERDESPHKEVIEQALVGGKIVPVAVSLSLLKRAMEEEAAVKGRQVLFLVDGFPRNFDNLEGWCREMNDVTNLQAVLVYQCPLEVLEERILLRAADSGRSDDNLESLRKRFRTFETDTVPVVDILREAQGSAVFDIEGNQPLDDVWRDTQRVLNSIFLNDVLTANQALLSSVETGNLDVYRALTDPDWFVGDSKKDAAEVMRRQEGEPGSAIVVECAQVDVLTGRQVAVSYDRSWGNGKVREKRIWSHQGVAGWRNIHFARTPVTRC
jgi:UMP-CMP kinase